MYNYRIVKKEIYKLRTQGEKVNLKNNDSIALCLDYSEDAEKLQELISQLEITVEYKGNRKVFERKEDSALYEVEIKRGDKSINFEFNQSINYTDYMPKNTNDINYSGERFQGKFYNRGELARMIEKQQIKEYNSFLYSILCCIKTDGYITDIFEDFCSDFGYNEDSRKDYELFLQCNKQAKKIRKIFSTQDLEYLPQ
jgi:hypothetical protein